MSCKTLIRANTSQRRFLVICTWFFLSFYASLDYKYRDVYDNPEIYMKIVRENDLEKFAVNYSYIVIFYLYNIYEARSKIFLNCYYEISFLSNVFHEKLKCKKCKIIFEFCYHFCVLVLLNIYYVFILIFLIANCSNCLS